MKWNVMVILNIVGILICFVSGSTTHATATTHIWGPSADFQAFNVWHLTSDIYIASEQDSAGNTVAPITNLGLTVGLLPFEKLNMEMGFDHKSGLGSADNYPWYGNIKLGIPEGTFGSWFPAIAIGAFDLGTEREVTDYNVLYVKTAKAISVADINLGRISLGYFSGNEDLLLNGEGEKDNSGVMAAWERTIDEISDKLWICTEYMATKSAYGSWNVGLSWKFAPNVGVLAGYTVYHNESLANTATIQIDIDF